MSECRASAILFRRFCCDEEWHKETHDAVLFSGQRQTRLCENAQRPHTTNKSAVKRSALGVQEHFFKWHSSHSQPSWGALLLKLIQLEDWDESLMIFAAQNRLWGKAQIFRDIRWTQRLLLPINRVCSVEQWLMESISKDTCWCLFFSCILFSFKINIYFWKKYDGVR